jgi:hypothetical protein
MAHREEATARSAAYRLAHIDQWREYQAQYRADHREKRREQQRARIKAMPPGVRNQLRKALAMKVKIKVLTHYGNGVLRCVQCGEARMNCLTIDHVNGGGTRHRKGLGRQGKDFYHWLNKNGLPLGYQTLCMNCQFIKRFDQCNQ